jgi:4-amino-4-deoxychorismate lyase
MSYHNQRMNQSRAELFACKDTLQLEKEIILPADLDDGLYKCTIVYEKEIKNIQIVPYIFKRIDHIRIVQNDSINYKYKYFDRSCFKDMMADVKTEEILIVKNNCLTDTSFSNIILSDENKWVTPSMPLLCGTMRQYLLDQKMIYEEDILVRDLLHFKTLRLINAMNTFEDQRDFEVKKMIGI